MDRLIRWIKANPFLTILIALSAILLAAVVALICLLCASKKSPAATALQQYYDNKCFSYAVQNTNLAKKQIVFVGDSITDLYVLDDHYADLPQAVYNRGIGGDTTAGVLARLQVSVLDLQPDIVVLMIGTNDVNGGVAEETILQNYADILDAITSGVPGVQIYCMSVIPQNKQLEIDVDTSMQRIRQLNSKIKALAEEKGAVYLDLFPLLLDATGYLRTDCSDDGIHLNFTGLQIWTALLKPYLQ